MIIYTVRAGDTVYQIAKSHSVTPAAIVQANGLEMPDQLVVGQSLIIPSAFREHIAAAGDTLFRIAQRFGITLQALLGANPQITNPHMIRIGQRIYLPRESFGTMLVNGYCYPNISGGVLGDILPLMSMICVFSAQVDAEGNVTPMQNDERVVNAAKTAKARSMLVITNLDDSGFNPEIARAVLLSAEKQEKVLRQAMAIIKQKGYGGLDVDFENVPRDAREGLNEFLARAQAALHAEQLLLSSAVPPLTQDNQTGLLFEGFDFTAQGKYNDYVTLMTYEWGHQGGPPRAVAPLNEVHRAVEYAISRMPREKILMGIPNYGYDWKIPYQPGTRATTISNVGGVNIARREGAAINFDIPAQTPWFRYEADGQRHEVWFEDARSINAKLGLAVAMGIGGVSYWSVNTMFPQNWTLVDELVKVRKDV